MPPAGRARADGVITNCRHIIWPLGAEEGRVLATAFFSAPILGLLPVDRFGAPRGFLHTYCRSQVLLWVGLSPGSGLGLDDAYTVVTEHVGRGTEKKTILLRPASDLPMTLDTLRPWLRQMAEALDLPQLEEGCGWHFADMLKR